MANAEIGRKMANGWLISSTEHANNILVPDCQRIFESSQENEETERMICITKTLTTSSSSSQSVVFTVNSGYLQQESECHLLVIAWCCRTSILLGGTIPSDYLFLRWRYTESPIQLIKIFDAPTSVGTKNAWDFEWPQRCCMSNRWCTCTWNNTRRAWREFTSSSQLNPRSWSYLE